MELFTPADFKIFDLADFNQRMGAIISRIRPKLTSIGEELAPEISSLVDRQLFVHVAKHARRTVNPPDDTWAAFGVNPRGYKKDVHFKVAISRNCVRFLFEVGPEYYAKSEWTSTWHREFKQIARELAAGELAWFKDEHDEDPAKRLKDLTALEIDKLGDELTRRRDGQLVLGRRVDATELTQLKPKQVAKIALEAFKPSAKLFLLHDARVLA